MACCGGFRYSPITSVIFSRNFGSRDSLRSRCDAASVGAPARCCSPWTCSPLGSGHGAAMAGTFP
jgi:hypothetical protein